jgi:hypothetical protein
MKPVHYSLIQWNYSFIATFSVLAFIGLETLIRHRNGTLHKIPFVWKNWIGYAEIIGSGVFNLLGQNLMTISN